LSLVSPLSRVLGLGSARGGAEHWWAQRVTAVALVPLGIWFVLALVLLPDYSYATLRTWVSQPVTAVLLILTVISVVYHSKLGVQVVVEDYVHAKAVKVAGLMLSTLLHIAVAVAAVFAILRIAIGAL
jgi:succinate dehydrogenase / fumarate reductase, membrane anchor subunit